MDINHVAVIAMPTDYMPIAILTVSIASGVLIPIYLIVFTIFSRKFDRKQQILNSVHDATRELFKSVQSLLQINDKRIKNSLAYNGYKELLEKTRKENPSASTDSILEAIIKEIDYELASEAIYGKVIIDIAAARHGLEYVLDNVITNDVTTVVDEINDFAKEINEIPGELNKRFIAELNKLNETVEDNPEKWLK